MFIRALTCSAACASLVLVAPTGVLAQTTTVTSVSIATGLANPDYVACPPSDSSRLFILEQRGNAGDNARGAVRIVKNGMLLATPFLTIQSATDNEQGLLGMAFHPDFANNRKVYINYTNAAGNTVIEERQASLADPDVADTNPATIRTILTFTQPFTNHNGGWLDFGPDGFLYIATGDGGSGNDPGNRASQLTTGGVTQFLGKLLRLDVNNTQAGRNYAIPPGNPFGSTPATPGAEIWAYGLRNPFRDSFDRATGDLWIGDVGQNEREEVNYQPTSAAGGRNYGWRCFEGNLCTSLGGCVCANTAGLIFPVIEYSHTSTAINPIVGTGITVIGGYVYRGGAIPSLRGLYLFADFGSGKIFAYNRAANSTVALAVTAPAFGFTSFGQDAAGEVYYCIRGSGTDGEVRKFVLSCRSDFDGDSCLTPVDLLSFLALYFTNSDGFGSGVPGPGHYAGPCTPAQQSAAPPVVTAAGLQADYDGDCQVASTDLLGFLVDYFNPTPGCTSGCAGLLGSPHNEEARPGSMRTNSIRTVE